MVVAVTLVAVMVMTLGDAAEGSAVTRIDRVKFARKWMDDAKARGGLDASEGVDVGDATEDGDDGFAVGGGGRLGLRVGSTPVEKMEAYVRVRWNETIHPSAYDAREHPLGAALAALRSEHGKDEKTALVLCLIYERFERRDESVFMDYFRAMPEEFDTPTFWSETSAKELRGSDTYEKDIVEEFKLINKMWGGLRRRVFDVYTDVFTQSSSKSLYALRWAWAVVHSRAVRVSGKEGLALVPVLDMIHECGGGGGGGDSGSDDDGIDSGENSEEMGVDREAEDAGFAVYDKHADEVVVYAKRDYRPNEDICERFGSWNNGESLQHFGYLPDVDEDDMRNCVLMILEPEKRYSDTILKAGFDVPWRVCVPRSPTQASLDLFAAYAELAAGRRVDIDESGVPRNVSRIGALNIINERLTRYPTTIDQDEYALRVMRESRDEFSKSIRDGSLALLERVQLEAKMHEVRRSALAIELRFREKKILKTLADRISLSVNAGSGVKDEL